MSPTRSRLARQCEKYYKVAFLNTTMARSLHDHTLQMSFNKSMPFDIPHHPNVLIFTLHDPPPIPLLFLNKSLQPLSQQGMVKDSQPANPKPSVPITKWSPPLRKEIMLQLLQMFPNQDQNCEHWHKISGKTRQSTLFINDSLASLYKFTCTIIYTKKPTFS